MDFLQLSLLNDSLGNLRDYNESYVSTYRFSNLTGVNLLYNRVQQTSELNELVVVALQIFIGCLLYLLTIWTIIGNVFILFAISTNKILKQSGMSNYLIGNLALSDLLLGVTVLPFSATFSTFKTWMFGKLLCNVWLSIDVLCCTASIWGLCFIALDRFIATNHPIRYMKQKKNVKTALIYCTIPWLISIILSLGPLAIYTPDTSLDNAKSAANMSNMEQEHSSLQPINGTEYFECVLFHKPSFVIISSIFSFYLPLLLMTLLYLRVFMKISQQSKRFNKNRDSTIVKKPKANAEEIKLLNKSNLAFVELEPNEELANTDLASQNVVKPHVKKGNILKNLMHHHGHQISSSEARITKTLAIIMSCFVACWLPFFVIYIIRSFLSDPSYIPDFVMDFFIWLGYLNSSLNPIIYLILNVNFRNTLKDILSCRAFTTNKNAKFKQSSNLIARI